MTQTKNLFFISIMGLMTLTSVFNRADAAPAKASPAIAHQTDVSGKYIPNAVAIAEQLHPTANLSYKVAGKRYYPTKKVTADFSQTGRASWYGPGFHGKKTSNGERFDMNMMTAAHPTLPIPSYVRVTNLDNGKTAVVRINDRGPFHGNRAIDLSKAAANKLGFLSKGTANVRIDVLTADERTNPPANTLAHKDDVANITTGKNIYVSLKTFDNKHEAQNFLETTAAHLKQIQAEQRAIMVKHGKAYLVRVGPFTEQEHADKIHNGLKQDVI